jgi:addiction module RelE/StbE family toxin
MAVVRWTDQALRDFDEILAYVERQDPLAAIDLVETIIASGNALKAFPLRNPIRYHRGVRERPILGTRYTMCYEVEDDRVFILCVRYGGRADRGP